MIALVGSGEYLPGMESVDRYLLDRLDVPARVVCLPTAAGLEGEQRIRYWSDLGEQYFARLGARVSTVPIITSRNANDPALADQVRRANFVYLSGGKPDYLLRTLQGSLTWRAILEVLAGGGILAGCSAGAMVCGSYLLGFPGFRPAFGLLPGAVVIPHFDEIPGWMAGVLRLWIGPGRRLVGVPGYTAVFVENGACRVLGRGPVVLWGQGGRSIVRPGTDFTWDRIGPGG